MTKGAPAKAGEQGRAKRVRVALAPGLHAATIDLASKGTYRVRTATGERVRARLGPGVDPALAEECLKQRRTVLVAAHPDGPFIVGALQVMATESREKLRLVAKEIELCAGSKIALRVGKSLVLLDEHGVVQMVGEGLTMRMARSVRVRSVNVELP